MSENSTKRNISDTFVEVLKNNPAEKVTVKQLAEACGITRQTFYYHFHDILDVLAWGMEQKTREVLEETMKMDRPRDAFYLMLSGCREDREAIKHLMESEYRADLEQLFLSSVRKYLEEMIQRKKLLRHVSRVDLDMTLRLYSYAMTGLFLDVTIDTDVDIEALADQLDNLLQGAYLQLPIR